MNTTVSTKTEHERGVGELVFGSILGWFSRPAVWRHFWFLPPLAFWRMRRYKPRVGSWAPVAPAEGELRDVAGIRRNPAEEERAFEDAPLQDWVALHTDAVTWLYRHGWQVYLPAAPRLVRAVRRAGRVGRRTVTAPTVPIDPAALTAALKAKAAEIGISAVGVAQYDEKYTFASCQGNELGDRIVVCILEQNWEATQTIPSTRAEKSALIAYADLIQRSTSLAEWIQEQGYRAKAHDVQGETVVLHYAVQAGLGQMGVNGQVLTPQAGSRTRVLTLTTNAPFEFDSPVDYGINKICDECQICVRRCPSGAIPGKRKYYRGIEKSKLNTARCFPVVAQAHGCAICMKVCPVQRYGLEAVRDEYVRTGRILGKDTDELEAYTFQGERYGPGARPTLRRDWFHPEGFPFDPERKLPLIEAQRDFG